MKTVLRTLISLCLIAWIGAEFFFPVVAAITFTTLAPDTHSAGKIVGACLRILHNEGLVAGAFLIILIAFAARVGLFSSRTVKLSIALLVVMLGLTAYSQFSIIPRMEQDRIQAGGAVSAAALDDPARVAFYRLHKTSEHIEQVILILGLILVGAVADPEESQTRRPSY
jgi:Domain of unknown function (DUF4149)